jgi:uncharacterized protein YndB with AHSA1/START domain
MSNESTSTIELHRVLKAPAERVYRAFLDPDAMAKWLPPHGFTAKVHQMNAEVGGSYRTSFKNFSTGKEMFFGGEFLELVVNQRLVYTDRFEDENLPGEMITTIVLESVFCGTDVRITQSGVPAMIPAAACYLGWQESLGLLANLVEADIPDE